MKGAKKNYIGVAIGIVIFVFASSYFLFYHQITTTDPQFYYSDMQAHVRWGINGGGYSLIEPLFYLAYWIWPTAYSLAFVLTLIIVSTIFAVALLIKEMLKLMGVEASAIWTYIIIASSSIYLAHIYIPVINRFFYWNSSTTQPWHSCTYLLMRLFGILAVLVYFRLRNNYIEKLSLIGGVLFTLLLFLTNYAKPNFIIEFAPTMLLFLIKDLFDSKGKGIWQIIKFGLCVLFSLGILIFQTKVLFVDELNSGVGITLENIVSFFGTPTFPFHILCNMIFPLLVLIISIRKKSGNIILAHGWVMFIIGWLEAEFLTELGERRYHGNFTWGCKFASFLLYIISLTVWIKMYQLHQISKRTYMIGWGVYILSIISGIIYFGIVLTGHTYLM